MIPLDEARRHVLGRVAPAPPRLHPLDTALGLVVSEQVVTAELVPPFDNTAMDGFAVRAVDTAGATAGEPVALTIVATLAAGEEPKTPVGGREAIRIMTGAPIPIGADAVVMVERTTVADDGATVLIETAAAAGDHIRRAGDDLQPGDVVVAAGSVLSPAHLGVLASVGVAEVAVHPRPRVGVLSTGDELVEGGAPLRPGQIRDSNRHALLAAVSVSGFEPVDLGLARDDEPAIRGAIERGVGGCDALLTSGGVSMGDFDYVKKVLDEMSADMRWMQIAIRPAKPLAFGTVGGVPVFGLPGNPVSSMVSFELFARPALRKMAGWPEDRWERPRVAAVADGELRRRSDGKVHFVRVLASFGDDGRVHVRSSGGQGSHQLAAMAAANALAVLPDGDGVGAGDDVDAMLLDGFRQ